MNSAKEHFSSLLQGATVQALDPMACIPFTRIRNIVDGCVDVLCRIFESAGGITTGGSMAYVIKLEGVYASFPLDYFREKLGSEEAAEKELNKRNEWYGVVDGEHRASALQRLICKDPEKWAGFTWTVHVLNTTASIASLRAFARACNQKNVEDFVVVPTQYDVLRNLKQDYITLSAKLNRSARPIELAVFYSGSKEACTSTTKQLAACVIRLPQSVIDTLGEIMNEENEEVATQIQAKMNSKQKKCAAVDYRLYRNLITSSTLKGSTPFMNAEGKDGETSQLNALWRIKEISRSSGFGPTKASVLTEQFLAAVAALQEVKKFERIMETSVWPKEMEVMKRNAERTQLFDEEISANFGNDLEPLVSFFNAFKTACPAIASQKLYKFKGTSESNGMNRISACAETDRTSRVQDVSCADPDPLTRKEMESIDDIPSSCKDLEEPIRERIISSKGSPIPNLTSCESPEEGALLHESDKRCESGLQQDSFAPEEQDSTSLDGDRNLDFILEEAGIHCYAMEWQKFEKNCELYERMKGNVSTILTDPPYSLQSVSASGAGSNYDDFLDDKEINDFSQFARRVLAPEGSVVMFTSWQTFPRWSASFSSNGFQVLNYPIVVAKDTKTLRRNGRLKMPQNAVDYVLLAYAPGKGRTSSRSIDFECPYQLIQCSHSRKFNIIDNVPVPSAKLQQGRSRRIVRVEEKNVDLIQELLTSFCTPGGLVCDPFAGTLTTAIACIHTSREAIVIEKDRICMNLAKERLSKIASNVLAKRTRLTTVLERAPELELRPKSNVEEENLKGIEPSDAIHSDQTPANDPEGAASPHSQNSQQEREGNDPHEDIRIPLESPNQESPGSHVDVDSSKATKRSNISHEHRNKTVRKSKRLKKDNAKQETARNKSVKRVMSTKNVQQSGPLQPCTTQNESSFAELSISNCSRTNCILGNRCEVLSLMPVGEVAMTSHRCDFCKKHIHTPCEYGRRVLGLRDRCEQWACSKECFDLIS